MKSQSIKIVRLNTYSTGGAAKSVFCLHEALLKKGINDSLLVAYGSDSGKYDVVKPDAPLFNNAFFQRIIDGVVRRLPYGLFPERYQYKVHKLQKECGDVFFSLPLTHYKSLVNLPKIENADIVNLHWVGNFVDIPSFFSSINKPIVWTLHDENPGRGGLHYACDYDRVNKLDQELFRIKKRFLYGRNINIVVQSSYMKEYCLTNSLLKQFPITIINNATDVDAFIPYPKKYSRDLLSLPYNAVVFMFSSLQLEDERKGMKYILQALEKFNDKNICLLCVGQYYRKIETKINCKYLGFVDDIQTLSLAYSASDYFVLPSLYESFAKTPLEAMACGVPVIAFPCSGIKDCVTEESGVVCEDFSSKSLYEGIIIAMSRNYDSRIIRKKVMESFTYDIMANKYCELYNSIQRNNLYKM